MSRHKREGAHRYNKVNQQKKFHLLALIFKQGIPIREAAQRTSINFLTAKTIVFFYKNNYKSYQFDLRLTPHLNHHHSIHATYQTIAKISKIGQKLIKPKSRIQVICSIGNVLSPPVEKTKAGQSEALPNSPLLQSQQAIWKWKQSNNQAYHTSHADQQDQNGGFQIQHYKFLPIDGDTKTRKVQLIELNRQND